MKNEFISLKSLTFTMKCELKQKITAITGEIKSYCSFSLPFTEFIFFHMAISKSHYCCVNSIENGATKNPPYWFTYFKFNNSAVRFWAHTMSLAV